MNYNKLTSQEERVIVDKATEPPFLANTTIFMKTEHLSVEDVMRLSFHRKASLMQDVDGQALMKTSRMQ